MKKTTILVADDSKLERTEVADVLMTAGYEVIQAQNGKEAWDELNKQPKDKIDFLITDIVMPSIDGFELMRLMKLSPDLKQIPVMMMTATSDPDNEAKAMDAGAEDILAKPFEDKVLTSRVKHILLARDYHESFHNIMEDLVAEQVDDCIDSLGICGCQTCRKDLMTLTLNRLKPRYVTTEKGRLMSKLSTMSYNDKAEVLSTITECAEIVKKHPNHLV